MPAAPLRIDTSVVGIAGPSSNHNSAHYIGSAPGGSRLRSAKSATRLRRASSASASSTSSNPAYALNKATAAASQSRSNGNGTSWSPIDKPLPSSPGDDPSEYVLAMHDFEPHQANVTCLTFKAGQIVRVFNRDPSGWWDGEVDSRRGWFPSNYVTSEVGLLTDEELPQLLVSSTRLFLFLFCLASLTHTVKCSEGPRKERART